MDQKLYVLLGDVVSSRLITDRDEFQEKLTRTCEGANSAYASDVWAGFRILKGLDEVGAVLSTIAHAYDIVSALLDGLYPNLMRFVIVRDYIDAGLDTGDVSRMDGPAFHRAVDMMEALKKSKLTFDMSSGDEVMDAAIAGQINSILLLKQNWSAKQREVVREYERTRNQVRVAQTLGITQQAVSEALARTLWKQARGIEQKLNYVLLNCGQRQLAGEANS